MKVTTMIYMVTVFENLSEREGELLEGDVIVREYNSRYTFL